MARQTIDPFSSLGLDLNTGESLFGLDGVDSSLQLSSQSNYIPSFGFKAPARAEALEYGSPTGGFSGYTPSVNYSGSSFGGIGSAVGSMAGKALGSQAMGAIGGGLVGGAVDMYMQYRAGEAAKRAERKRLEEARRQQIAARRREEADRRFQMQQYEDTLGFRQADEARNQATFDINMKQKKADMMRQAMLNSINDNQAIRDIFAKRGVI